MNLSLLLSQLFNGLQTGSIYALVALGYSMVYGIILLLNFAHGDIIMVGAYAAFYAMTNFHLHPIVSVIIAVITSTLLGVVIEKGCLYAAAKGAETEPAYHRDRYLVPSGKRRAAALWLRYEEHGSHCSGQYFARLCDHQQRSAVDHYCDHRCHGCPDRRCAEDEARQGHARRV